MYFVGLCYEVAKYIEVTYETKVTIEARWKDIRYYLDLRYICQDVQINSFIELHHRP